MKVLFPQVRYVSCCTDLIADCYLQVFFVNQPSISIHCCNIFSVNLKVAGVLSDYFYICRTDI